MTPLLLLSLTLSASPGTRLLYEQKCLYCHSAEVSERQRMTPPQWRANVEKMRLKAPLLITRTDAQVITAYIVENLKLVPAGTAAQMPVAVARRPMPPKPKPTVPSEPVVVAPAPEPEPLTVITMAPITDPAPAAASTDGELSALDLAEMHMTAEDEAAEREGSQIMQQRCSKCHTLNRVFGKLDTYERSMATLRRMRLKTGSGITEADTEMIERFLKLDLENADKNSVGEP